jgi:hypothetical protein
MKKSKIFIGAGLLVLSIAGFVTRKNSMHKFVSFPTCVTAGGTAKVIGTTSIFTTVANNSQAYILTAGGTQRVLFTKVNRIKICYLK